RQRCAGDCTPPSPTGPPVHPRPRPRTGALRVGPLGHRQRRRLCHQLRALASAPVSLLGPSLAGRGPAPRVAALLPDLLTPAVLGASRRHGPAVQPQPGAHADVVAPACGAALRDVAVLPPAAVRRPGRAVRGNGPAAVPADESVPWLGEAGTG